MQKSVFGNFFFVIGKIEITEFYQPPSTNDFDNYPLPIRHPQISLQICETMCCRVSIDYIHV